eukprot:12605.XXX_574251_574535_1 [CDS] Oithona nana genome sequencing.
MYPSPVSPPPAVLVALYTQYSTRCVSSTMYSLDLENPTKPQLQSTVYYSYSTYSIYRESRREQVYTVLSYIMTNCSIETILYAKIFVSILVNLA